MTEKNVYEKLRERMGSWALRLPETKEILEILKIVFSEEEAEILSFFSAPFKNPKTNDEISKESNKPLEKIKNILNNLLSKGLITCFTRNDGELVYSLMPFIPGWWEFYIVTNKKAPEKKKLASLFEKFYENGFGQEIGASNYPYYRVVPVEKTIKINQTMGKGHLVLPFERMSQLVREAEKIAVWNCACRTTLKCEHPLETCLTFDSGADFIVEKGYGRYLNEDEALELLQEMEKIGLVHTTINTSNTKPTFICNCCSCACIVLRSLKKLNNPSAIAKSNFTPTFNSDLCIKCKKCVNICPMDALIHHSTGDKELERIVLLKERCIGCGLCTYHCPQKAIKLVKIRDQIPENSIEKVVVRRENERSH